jgi:phosphoribosyl 1,2-cyclic phosphodiesterase
MHVRFWGVRGSIGVSGSRYVRTGGNTSCVEVLHEGHRLILDGGTGLRALGDELGRTPLEAALLFSHVHWDHIQGVPFFAPAFHPDSRLTLCGAPRPGGKLREALEAQMRPPQFPITLDALRARLQFVDLVPGRSVLLGAFRVTPVELNHPDGVLGFRIEAGTSSLVYATDHEHGGRMDGRLLDLAAGADLLIHDAQYTAEEYAGGSGPSRRGWGHSTWAEAVEAARQAQVGRLALFHHDPQRDDEALARIEALARESFPAVFAAREGEVVAL